MTVDCIDWDSVVDLSSHPLGPPNEGTKINVVKKERNHTLLTCLLNQNNVFRKFQKVRPIFFNSGQLTGSGDMCPEIKSIFFSVLLPKKRVIMA